MTDKREHTAEYRTALEAELSLPCTYCGAKPLARCHTKAGVTRYYCHAARWYDAKEQGLLPIPRVL